MRRSFYVDDCLTFVDTKEAMPLSEDLSRICWEGRFKSTKWIRNSRMMPHLIPESDKGKEITATNLDADTLPTK